GILALRVGGLLPRGQGLERADLHRVVLLQCLLHEPLAQRQVLLAEGLPAPREESDAAREAPGGGPDLERQGFVVRDALAQRRIRLESPRLSLVEQRDGGRHLGAEAPRPRALALRDRAEVELREKALADDQ